MQQCPAKESKFLEAAVYTLKMFALLCNILLVSSHRTYISFHYYTVFKYHFVYICVTLLLV